MGEVYYENDYTHCKSCVRVHLNRHFFYFTCSYDMMDTIEMKELSDVKDHWGKTFTEELVSKDIVSGYPDQTFRPDNTITRAEFIVMLLKARRSRLWKAWQATGPMDGR